MTVSAHFNRFHRGQELGVVPRAISARVNASVAVRTKSNDKPRVVRATIAEPPNVVWLEIGNSVRPKERSGLTAPLTMALCSSDNVVAHVAATLKHSGNGLNFARRGICCGEGPPAQLREIEIRGCLALYNFDNAGDGAELKNNRVAHFARLVRCALYVVPFANILVFEAKAILRFPEKQQARSVRRMCSDPGVSPLHHHVAKLALTKIFEYAVIALAIRVSVDEPFLTGDDENDIVLSRRDDPTLLLPAKPGVNIAPAVVNPPALEPPRHRRFPACCVSAVLPPLSCAPVNRPVRMMEAA